MRHLHPLRGVAAALLVAAAAFTADAVEPPGPEIDRRWLDRLEPLDRELLDALIGKAPPAPAGDLRWIGATAADWDAMRGSVVVVQSWTCRSATGRSWPTRLGRMAESANGEVHLLALHTPEGADAVDAFLARRPAPVPVIIDPSGTWCDALGVYRRPVNIVIDRQGAVRYVGLNQRGLEEAVGRLRGEPFDASRPAPEPFTVTVESAAEFPPWQGPVANARDVRGRRAPEMAVEQWITARPDANGKVVMIDFWATWCGPCVASIPHVNQLADRFGDELVIVGLSDERPADFESGLRRRQLGPGAFRYALALDPQARMKSELQVRGIPHAIVMSSDWVVRWQGHPASLNTATLERIVAANGSSGGSSRARWRR